MCQKFIGYFKNILQLVRDHIHHMVTCSDCRTWMKHVYYYMKGGKGSDS